MRPFVCLLVVAALGGTALADNVDWSQYIEKPGTTYVVHSAPAPAPVATKAPAKHAIAKTKTKAALRSGKRGSRRSR